MTIADWIAALNIFARNHEDGLEAKYVISSEHDEIFFHLNEDTVPEESEDGQELTTLGFSVNDFGCWSRYV